ncbi:hypothetical protein [Pseudomonas fluorescens]|uniref:hypothetical protein n=1 Tax=Pseudomonas fluorescens TaxID=294 RepID=UPI0012404161|nr:hypothetical protein [Pseudomonas fluorescens]VVN23016.1 hypothetical protein PS639_04389 [Pseudomonas fluorescens]
MVDLFRYVEHGFAVPNATDAIDVSNQSDFQIALGDAAHCGQGGEGQGAAEPVRALAKEFLATHFESPTEDPTALGHPLDALAGALGELSTVNADTVNLVIRSSEQPLLELSSSIVPRLLAQPPTTPMISLWKGKRTFGCRHWVVCGLSS